MMLLRACLFLFVSASTALAFPSSIKSRLFLDCSIYSDESPARFLGTISTSTFGDSILSTYGSYGSSYSSTSIRNKYSAYGSSYSSTSAYNPSASRPPRIVNSQNVIVGYVTKNTFKPLGIDPDFLIYGLTALNNWNFYSSLFYRELYAYDGTFLGIASPDGPDFSLSSIFNDSGAYGSEYGSQSAYNSYASTPPSLYAPQQFGGAFAAYVTKNATRTPAADPDVLRAALLLAPDMPWIVASSYSLSTFTTTQGTASPAQAVSIVAKNLVAPINISLLPTEKRWELSGDGSSYGSGLQLQLVNGQANAIIFARLSASAPLTATEPLGIAFSGFTIVTDYAGASIYRICAMRGTVVSGAAPTPTPTPTPPPKLSQTITFAQPANQVFAPNKTFTLSGTATSGEPVSFSSSNPNVLSISGNTATIKAAGSVTITASQGGNSTYNPAPSVARTLTVAKAAQSVSFTQPVNQTFAPNKTFALVASNSSGLPVTFVSGNSNVATISNNIATIRSAGSVTITATNSGNANFNAGGLARSVTIGKGTQSIRPFVVTNNVRFGATVTFTNTNSTAGLMVAFERVSGPVTVSSNRATVTGVGTVVVRAVQGGNANYNAAPPLTNTFTAVKAGQIITWTNLPATNNFVANGLISLRATSSSGLPVTYTSAKTNILQIVGTNAVIRGRGTNTITASQPGNTNYNAASNVVRTIVIR